MLCATQDRVRDVRRRMCVCVYRCVQWSGSESVLSPSLPNYPPMCVMVFISIFSRIHYYYYFVGSVVGDTPTTHRRRQMCQRWHFTRFQYAGVCNVLWQIFQSKRICRHAERVQIINYTRKIHDKWIPFTCHRSHRPSSCIYCEILYILSEMNGRKRSADIVDERKRATLTSSLHSQQSMPKNLLGMCLCIMSE